MLLNHLEEINKLVIIKLINLYWLLIKMVMVKSLNL